jgi:uncharacterized membrane protein
VAGLRASAAPAVLTWAAKRRWIRLGDSPFARIISAKASKRITHLAVSELVADKLPFTPSRLKAGPLASRVVSGAVCGATIYGAVEQPLIEGAVLGGVGRTSSAMPQMKETILLCVDWSNSSSLFPNNRFTRGSFAPGYAPFAFPTRVGCSDG